MPEQACFRGMAHLQGRSFSYGTIRALMRGMPGLLLLILLLILPGVFAADKKPSQPRPPEIEVLDASARREDRRLAVDGRLRNTGERPVKKLLILIDFLDSDRKTLTRQQGEADDLVLEAGEEFEFHRQTSDPARAVYFVLSFEDGSGREIRAVNPGPFPIE
jgi:hypothetical protein